MTQVTLEQWQTLIAVVDEGGYAQAAQALRKSQSAVSYAIGRMEESLGLALFRLQGRRAVLTPAGEALLRQARQLVESARQMESLASHYADGCEAEIRIAMDSIFPEQLMLNALARFAEQQPHTRITLLETVLSGTDEALLKREADLVISGRVPPGFMGDPLLTIGFLAVAHPDHPLHQLPKPLSMDDLRQHRQLVVRDSGTRRLDAGWLGAEQRWTLSSSRTSIRCACLGLGFAWFPTLKIADELATGLLTPLPLASGAEREVPLYLVLADGERAGPGVRQLAEQIRAQVNSLRS